MFTANDELITITRDVYSDIIKTAAEGLPNEAGGIVYTIADPNFDDRARSQNSTPISNVHRSPRHNYQGSAQETLSVYELLGEFEGEVVFVWHSHPTAESQPSEVDRGFHYPSRYLAIVSFSSGVPNLTIWRVKDWGEVQWQII